MSEMYDFGAGAVPAHRHKNTDGSTGGWVANTAKVRDRAYIGPNARIYGGAEVADNAYVVGNARVYGSALLGGREIYFDNMVICFKDYAS